MCGGNWESGRSCPFFLVESDVSVIGKDEHYIDFLVRDDSGSRWRASGIYGWPDNSQKVKTWDMINGLGRDTDLPWIVGGD